VPLNTGVNIVLGKDSATGRSNGSGKSSFLETIPYALFGQTHKEIKKAQLINWRSRKNCEVVLSFKKGEDYYEVLRAIKPDKFEIYENGNAIEFTGVKDYQSTLEEIIGLNFNTFCSLIHSNINSSNRILSMRKDVKRKFIENVFGLELYSFIDGRARDKLKNIDLKIQKLTDDIDRNNLSIKEAVDRANNLDQKLSLIKSSEVALNDALIEFTDLVNENPDIDKKCRELDSRLERITESVLKLREVSNNVDNRIRMVNRWSIKGNQPIVVHYEDEKEFVRIETMLKAEQAKLDNLVDHQRCPTCDQTLKHGRKDIKGKIKADIQRLTGYLSEINDRIVEQKQLITLKAKEDKLRYNKTADKLDKLSNTLASKLTRLESKHSLLREERDGLGAIDAAISLKKAKIEELKRQTALEESAREEFRAMIATEEQTIKRLSAENRELDKKAKTLSTIKDYLVVIRDICKDENIKQFAISSIMPYLNKQTNHYLSEVGYGFYTLIDRWLDADIKGPGVTGATYGSLSGGESRGIDLALQFALLDIARIQAGIWPDIVIMDEILDSSVDSEGIAKLTSIIKSKQHEDQSKMFIISHRDEIDDFSVDNTYYINKTDGYSNVEVQ
jgi:DNA repair exonuclease SbcCD ATPase subunit